MLLWPWVILLCFLIALIAIDLGVLTRRPREATPTEALLSVFLWFAAAGIVSLAINRLYQEDLWGVRESLGHAIDPRAAWLQFVTAYVTELALSIDNVAVLGVIFAHFRVAPEVRARMLLWVMVVCLGLRAVLIVAGAELLRFPWMPWVFAAALLVGAAREFLLPRSDADLGDKLLIRLTRRLPTTTTDHGQRLIARERLPDAPGSDGQKRRWVFTPLMMVFLAAAAADLSFAADSLPAVFAVTRDPLIAFASNALAILALRSLYFVLAPVIGRFRYMKISLCLILLYLAAVMAWEGWRYGTGSPSPLTTEVTLTVVSGILALGAGASILHARRGAKTVQPPADQTAATLPVTSPTSFPPARPTPLEDVAEAAQIARRNLWKIGILIAGTAVIIFGIAIAPLPGPGPTVLIPTGLVILASEFVWAQRLLKVFKERSLQLAEQGDRVGELFPKWVLMPITLAYYGLFALWLINTESTKLRVFINATCFGLSFPFIAWVLRTAKMDLGPLNKFVYAKREGKED